MPATPSLDASLVRCTEWAVSLEPAPATTGMVTASTTAAQRLSFSSSVSVGASPVVPATTSPSLPLASSQRASVASRVEVETALGVERRDHGRGDLAEAGHQNDPSLARSIPSVRMRSSCSSIHTSW